MKIGNAKWLWADLVCLFTLSFVLRMVLILRNPDVYGFDAYIYLLGLSSEYPLFTGLVKGMISAGGSVLMIRIMIAVLGSVACVTFYLFARRVFSNTMIARSAAVLMSVYPSFLTFSLVPYTESLFFLVFFCGLWFFEKENDTEHIHYYAKTGICLGLACLTRYEAWLMVPLILMGIILRRKPMLGQFQRVGKSLGFRLLGIGLSLSWGMLVLLVYKYLFLPERIAHQSGGIQEIVKDLFPLLNGLVHFAWSKLVPDMIARGLGFPVVVFFAGLVIACAGCVSAMIQDRDKHVPYVCFIVLAMGIQLLPILLNYQLFGKIVGLRRHGMVPLVFLLLYLPCGIDLLIKKPRFRILNKKQWQRAGFIVILFVFVCASFQSTQFLLSDFRKLYRNSFIQPHWIGKSGDPGAGVIAAFSDPTLMAHLLGKPFRVFQPSNFNGMSPEDIRNYLEQKQIRYVVLDRKSFPVFDDFIRKTKSVQFRRMAAVGGWLFVYMRENGDIQ